MLVKLKEKSVQYKIAIFAFVIMIVIKVICLEILKIDYNNVLISVIDIIAALSMNFIFILLFRDVSYKKEYEEVILSASFIKTKNMVFALTVIMCLIYLSAREFMKPEITTGGMGIAVAGSAIQQFNFEVRKDNKPLKKVLICGLFVLIAIMFVGGLFYGLVM